MPHDVDHTRPKPKQTKRASSTDWKLCVLCQDDTGAALQSNQFKSLAIPIGNGYKSLTDHLTQF